MPMEISSYIKETYAILLEGSVGIWHSICEMVFIRYSQ
jgi:hypothetical protein